MMMALEPPCASESALKWIVIGDCPVVCQRCACMYVYGYSELELERMCTGLNNKKKKIQIQNGVARSCTANGVRKFLF